METFPQPITNSSPTAPKSRKSVAPKPLHELIVQTLQRDVERSRKMRRRVLGELLEQRLQLGIGGGAAGARFEPQVCAEFRRRIVIQLERQVDIPIAPGEARWHHADYGVGLVDKLQRTTHHLRVGGVMSLPILKAEHHHRLRILAERRIGRDEAAADQRRHAEMGGGIGCQIVRGHIFRKIFIGGGEVPPILAHHAFNRSGLAELTNLGAGQSRPVLIAGLVLEHQVHHAVRVLVRIRIHQDAVNHAEDSRGGANAQCQRENRGESEARTLAQLPQRENGVLEQNTHL